MYSPAGARHRPGRNLHAHNLPPGRDAKTEDLTRSPEICPGCSKPLSVNASCGISFASELCLLDVVLALEVLALDQLRYLVIVVVLLLALGALLHALVALGQLAERGERVGAELVEDARDELGELLVLTVAVEGEGVGGDRGVNCASLVDVRGWESQHRIRHTLGCGEVDDVAVRLEHVDLLNLSDGLDVHLLEGGLELLVIGARRPVDLFLDTSGGALAAVSQALASIRLRICIPAHCDPIEAPISAVSEL